MPDTKTPRLIWLDWANVLAMLGVVWFHIPSAIEEPVKETEFFAVNIAFFVLAGVSFEIARHYSGLVQTLQFYKQRFCRLIVPVAIFFFIFYALWLLIGRSLAGDSEAWYEPIGELLTGRLRTVIAPCWFVFGLFCMLLIFAFVPWKSKWRYPVYFLLGMAPMLQAYLNVPNYMELNQALLFIPFFAIGTALRKDHKALTLVVAGMAATLIGLCAKAPVNLCFSWIDVAVGSIYTAIIISLSLVFGRAFGQPDIIKILRYGSLVILATQNNIIGMSRVLMGKATGQAQFLADHIVAQIGVLILVYLISLPIIMFIKRYAPFILGRKKK